MKQVRLTIEILGSGRAQGFIHRKEEPPVRSDPDGTGLALAIALRLGKNFPGAVVALQQFPARVAQERDAFAGLHLVYDDPRTIAHD